MSAFLGPVHYWLYRKIQYQEQLNQKILKRICPQLNEIVAQECGTIQDGSLEEIIDHQAIHQLAFYGIDDSRKTICIYC